MFGKTLPAGTRVRAAGIVDDVTMRGAGPWYSVLHGRNVGAYGKYAPDASSDEHLADFAVFGETTERVDADQVNAIGGSLADSSIDDLWLQHNKLGVWLDGPFDRVRISRLRILDQTADGLNLHDGITNSSVTDTYVRSTGDDGMAMWSEPHPRHRQRLRAQHRQGTRACEQLRHLRRPRHRGARQPRH